MLYETLNFLKKEYNNYIRIKTHSDPVYPLVLGNIAQHETSKNNEIGENSLNDGLILSIINIEEEHAGKNMNNLVRSKNQVLYKNPAIHLNLYLLFSANINNYNEALKQLSWVIKFFQAQHVFSHQNSPSLPPELNILYFKLHPINFEQAFNFWGALGGKYIPSVLYKVRMLTVDQEVIKGDTSLIKEVVVSPNSDLQPTKKTPKSFF